MDLLKEKNMSVLPIIQLNKNEFTKENTVPRKKGEEVIDFGDDFQKIVDDLIDTLEYHGIAIGLSATQVGIPLRLSVINLSKDKNEPTLIIVNPKIISTSGKKDKKKESCMSLPHFQGEVERRYKINISYKDRYGNPQELNESGFLARVIFHEIDHLDGILYIDRMYNLSTLEHVDFFKEYEKKQEN